MNGEFFFLSERSDIGVIGIKLGVRIRNRLMPGNRLMPLFVLNWDVSWVADSNN